MELMLVEVGEVQLFLRSWWYVFVDYEFDEKVTGRDVPSKVSN